MISISTLPAFTETYTVMSSGDWLMKLRQSFRPGSVLSLECPLQPFDISCVSRRRSMNEQLWKRAKQRMEKYSLRNFFGFIWLLKTSFNSHISSTNSSSILASPSPPMSRNTDVRFCSEPEAHVCMPCTPCSFVLLLTVKKFKKDNSRSKPVHLSRHFLLPSVQKSLLNIM